jgi:AraC-like DNA-binding protein
LHQIDLFHGTGTVTVAGETTSVRRWALLFLPPGTEHTLASGTEGRFMGIGFKAVIDCRAACEFPPIVVTADAGYQLEPIQRDLQFIRQESLAGRVGSRQIIQSRSLSVILESVRLWVEGEYHVASHDIVQEACHFMALRYGEPITIDQVARHCGIRPESLSRAFHRVIGHPPRRYLIQLRLRQAMALLKTGVSVTETAQQTGFQSVHYFSRAFQSFNGISPRNWISQLPDSELRSS